MIEQQIIDAGIDYTMANCPICIGGAAFEDKIRQMNRNPSFEAGANWAKERLIKEVCEWIEKHMNEFCMEPAEHCMISWLRKAMEE